MAKKEKHGLSDTAKRVLLLIIGGTCTALVLTFSVLAILHIYQNDQGPVPQYLLGVFLSMAVCSVITFLKERTKIHLIQCVVLFLFNILLGVTVLFANENPYLFSLTAGLYGINFIIARLFAIFEKRNLRALILNLILIVFAALLSVGLFFPVKEENLGMVVLIECLFIAITSFFEVASVAFSNMKFSILFKIVVKTFALEVLFGLLALMVASSLILMAVEPTITNFGDGLWYCFAVVTTIGFGDFHAETIVGRLISVVLGIYGIVAVAVITSIIVNFYNETSGKRDAKEIQEIQKEENKKK